MSIQGQPVAAGRRRAFTLVELLIVIGILGLLMSIAYPALMRARVLARRVACQATLRGVGIGLRMYLEQSDMFMPVAANKPSLRLNDEPRIRDVLADCLSGPDAMRCPADNERNYWQSEGSSYAYSSLLGGRRVGASYLTREWGEENTPVMNDYEPFHRKAQRDSGMNWLFADGHVAALD